ncbi:MAG: hypothetical protein M1835_003075, partial [Candelina submexicana]
ALLAAGAKLGIAITYGSKLVSIINNNESGKVIASFSNERSANARFIVGCDGTHSTVRLQYVEPDRKPEYTGVATAYAIIDNSVIKSKMYFLQTAVNMTSEDLLTTSYIDPEHAKLYVAVLDDIGTPYCPAFLR